MIIRYNTQTIKEIKNWCRNKFRFLECFVFLSQKHDAMRHSLVLECIVKTSFFHQRIEDVGQPNINVPLLK